MKVIFVCTANVCRSPLAEGYFKSVLRNHGASIEVISAGVAALTGAPAFDCAVDVAKLNNFDITQHRAQQLTPAMIQEADMVLCMETWQASTVIEMEPKMMHKISLLGQFHPTGQRLFQIPDPADFNVPETRRTFEMIKSSVEGLLQSLPSARIR